MNGRQAAGHEHRERARKSEQAHQSDERQRLLRSLDGPRPPAPALLELQRTIGNARTARVLARRGGAQGAEAAPPLDQRTAALEAELFDPALAPKIDSLRAAIEQALKVGGAFESAMPQGDYKIPPALKLVDRLWKAIDPEERRKLADRLAGRPAVSVMEWVDFSVKVLKDSFDVYVSYVDMAARLAGRADALETVERLKRLGKVGSFLGIASDAFSIVYGMVKLFDSAEKPAERLSGGVGAAAGGAKLAGTAGAMHVGGKLAAETGGKVGAWAFAPTWAVRLTAIGTAIEIAYLQQEMLAGMYSDSMLATTAPSVEREYRQLSGAMREVAKARVNARHVYEHWARAQEQQDELTEAIEWEFHDALRYYQSSVNGALTAFDRLRYRKMKTPYLDKLDELGKHVEIAMADPATASLAAFTALEEIAGGLYSIAAGLFKDKEKMLKAAAVENINRFHGRPVE